MEVSMNTEVLLGSADKLAGQDLDLTLTWPALQHNNST
jgi:hypothetical protein